MSHPVIENKLLESIKELDVDQKGEVLDYVMRISDRNDHKENLRRRAIREIRSALKGSFMF